MSFLEDIFNRKIKGFPIGETKNHLNLKRLWKKSMKDLPKIVAGAGSGWLFGEQGSENSNGRRV